MRKKEGSLAQRLKSAYNLHFRAVWNCAVGVKKGKQDVGSRRPPREDAACPASKRGTTAIPACKAGKIDLSACVHLTFKATPAVLAQHQTRTP